MKKKYLILIMIVVLIVVFIVIFRPGGGGEDSWIKDERGAWIKHGNPSETPDYVLQQQQVINGALQLYEQRKSQDMDFSSRCLGLFRDYAVDIVHVPKNIEDNRPENQCRDYRVGRVKHFIELDKNGDVVRVV